MIFSNIANTIIVFILCITFGVSAYECDENSDPTNNANSQIAADSAISEYDDRQSEFEDEVNELFPQDIENIDTTGWCTSRINSWRFDYKSMTDSVRIPLVDSAVNRFFAFPFINVVTSPFGPRDEFWHFGQDIRLKVGDTVRCAFDGLVRVIENDRRGYGKVVVVRHQNGLETLYGHLSKTLVSVNQPLKYGDIVGLGGNTGRSTGSHLHFEMRFCGEPFDPNCIIDFQNYVLKSDTLVLTRDNFQYLSDLRRTIYHTVRRGETLGSIAHRSGTTVRKLCALNGIKSHTRLKVGRKIIVRTFKEQDVTITDYSKFGS